MFAPGRGFPFSMNPTRNHLIALLSLLLVAAAYVWSGMDAPTLWMDEGMLLTYPEQIAHGRLPYRDFETFYSPGNLFALLGAYQVFGFDVTVERVVGLIYRLAIIAGFFVIVRRWSLFLAVAAGVFAVLVIKVSWLIAYAWWGAAACVLWSLVLLAGQNTRWRIGLGGFLTGMALLFRQDMGVAVVLGTLPLWLRLSGRDRLLHLAGAAFALTPLLWV